jgi:hypothetical protein
MATSVTRAAAVEASNTQGRQQFMGFSHKKAKKIHCVSKVPIYGRVETKMLRRNALNFVSEKLVVAKIYATII